MDKVLTNINPQENELDSQLIQNENGLSQKVIRSIKAVLSKPGDIYRLFFLFTKKLNRLFSISQSSLIVYSKQDGKLKVLAMRGENGTRKGLALTLPEKNSLLYKVFTDGRFYIQNHPKDFNGNFIEEKILKDDTTQSLAILPISRDGSRSGLICLSSPNRDAFTIFENGLMDGILENFSLNLIKRMPPTNI